MTVTPRDLPGLLAYWAEQRQAGDAVAYGLLLCGTGHADESVFGFVSRRAAMLSDMSSLYCSLTVVAWQLDNPDDGKQSTVLEPALPKDELEYLYASHSWTVGAQGVYSLAQGLGLPLTALPAVVISVDPWSTGKVLTYPLGPLMPAESGQGQREPDDDLTRFFASLFTGCRNASRTPRRRRLRMIRKEMKRQGTGNRSGASIVGAISRTGIIEQVVEGIVKGLTPG